MKFWFSVFTLLCGVMAQAAPLRLSAPTRATLSHLPSEQCVQAFITYDDPTCLHGLKVNMRYDDVALVTLPAHLIGSVSSRAGVRQLALADKIHLQTDSSRSATYTDRVHQGYGLEHPYDGSGVVLGVIDVGIDYNHLAFRGDDGHNRIERVYLPTFSGGHPVVIEGDTLPGSHYATEAEIKTLTTDDATMTHGTHTLGIAGGSRVGRYGGMAPGARLVAVGIPNDSLSTALLLLGAKYIVDYARQLGLPCVISISMGDHVGAHDGTSPAARGFDAISKQGAIVVFSAGNEGSRQLHLHKDFDPARSAQGNWVGTVMRTTTGSAQAEVDAWSSDATPFALELQLYNTRDGISRFIIPAISRDTIINLDEDPVMRQYATGNIRVYAGVDASNGRYRIYSVFDTKMNDGRDFWAHIYRCDTVASIDVWNVDNRSVFSQMGRYDWVNGDALYSINDMATGHEVISVGSCSARDNYVTVNGATMPSGTACGNIASSSSYGTLPDGRQLPLVAAPGVAVISAISRYNSRSSWCYEQSDADGHVYRWSNMSGTSMSAPCVAGIIALWLQACPSLTAAQVQDIISKTSITDEITSQSPIRWGAGRINAFDGIRLALAMRPLPGDVNGDGVVDVGDVNLIINVVLSRPNISGRERLMADVNGDGVVDVADVNRVINVMLGSDEKAI